MEEKNQSCDCSCHSDGCRHGMCGHSGFHRCSSCLLYLLLGILALTAVFCLGLKLGELRSYYGGYYGYGRMMPYGGALGGNMMYRTDSAAGFPRMMQPLGQSTTTAQ